MVCSVSAFAGFRFPPEVIVVAAAPAMTAYPVRNALVRGASFRTRLKVTDPHGVAYDRAGDVRYTAERTYRR